MSHRTQLYLEDRQYLFLKTLAKSQKKSIAQIIREWVDEKVNSRKVKKYKNDPFFKARGLFESKRSDMAKHFDDYLYGDK